MGRVWCSVLIILLFCSSLSAREDSESWVGKSDRPDPIWIWDGTGIHNVGNLHMHVCNWGCFGSYPTLRWPISEFPSAQWPANSGVEYLWIAGLWVGARKNGVPTVSTAANDREFRPHATDRNNRIYRAFEGIAGGSRLPALPDDDRDGIADEDWQNGEDDDMDGRIDEDFAAISKQMFSCWFTDDQPEAAQVYPEHTPLHLFVRQESYQWEEEQYYDFVGVEYKIMNYGHEILEDVYIGFYADCDCGPRDFEEYGLDDATGRFKGVVCAQKGEKQIPVEINVAYFYDVDGDGGRTLGYFGVLFLGHDTDPLGENAPREIGSTSYQNFARGLPFAAGGDPLDDYQRYQLMTTTTPDRNADVPRDYRMMMATGPFLELWPDSTLVLQVAFVCGEGLEGMKESAASAAMAFDGNWFDVDGNAMTGVYGRETPVYGPAEGIVLDSCSVDFEIGSAVRGEIIWINADCRKELALFHDLRCPSGEATFADFQTGVDGKERQVHWLVGSAPPPPNMRVIPGDGKVTLLWDNFSEETPDASTLEYDFEGYRIWRADGWERPIGTSVLTGPSRDLWQLVEERDYINGIMPDREFRMPCSEGGWEYEPLAYIEEKDAILRMFTESLNYAPLDTVPCPPGLTDAECDTFEALSRYAIGLQGGMKYYRYVDSSVHNGMHFFFSVTAYDHNLVDGIPVSVGKFGDPSSNFIYTAPQSDAQSSSLYSESEVYVVPNPASRESISPWRLQPNMGDPSGIKIEFRNLPLSPCTIRIFTVSGDLVETLHHDGSEGTGTLPWDLVSRNGQDICSGVYLYAVEPHDGRFHRMIGKFVVIR